MWKLRLCAIEKLRGRFGVCGNLKGLFGCVKTLVCGAVGNLESAFRGIWKLRGGRFRSLETWLACTLETFGVHSWYSGTSVAFVRLVELRARSVVCGGHPSFSLFGELGGFCGVVGTSVFAFVYIFRSVGGVLSGG